MAAAPQPDDARRSRRVNWRDRRRGPASRQGEGQAQTGQQGSQQRVGRSSRRASRDTSRNNRNVIRLPFLRRQTPQKDKAAVTTLPGPTPTPQWLGTLKQVYRWSSVTVFGLGVVVAAVYSQTVRLEQDLGKTYSHLQNLQRQERELTLAKEQLKDQIARQAAQPESGLALPQPNDQVFLEPAQTQPPDSPRPNSAPVVPQGEASDMPVGY
ncbi:MAG: hypothetical protein AAGF75_09030 [Cyanobacteria bacterium P01_H01_bin.130]